MKTGPVLLITGAFILNTSIIISIYQKNYNTKLEEEVRNTLIEIRRLATESNRSDAQNRAVLKELRAELERFLTRQRQLEGRLEAVGAPRPDADPLAASKVHPATTDARKATSLTNPPSPVPVGNYLRIVGEDGKVYFRLIDQ